MKMLLLAASLASAQEPIIEQVQQSNGQHAVDSLARITVNKHEAVYAILYSATGPDGMPMPDALGYLDRNEGLNTRIREELVRRIEPAKAALAGKKLGPDEPLWIEARNWVRQLSALTRVIAQLRQLERSGETRHVAAERRFTAVHTAEVAAYLQVAALLDPAPHERRTQPNP